jgi:cytochrome c peroxidase
VNLPRRLAALLLASSGALGAGAIAGPADRVGDTPQLAAMVSPVRPLPVPRPEREALGRRLFLDRRLSSPPGTSCASCHDPSTAFSSLNGGRDGTARGSIAERLGLRNPPSLMYARYVPPLHFYQDDDALQPQPFGGLFLDGRADGIVQLVREPLLAAHEMNNGSEPAVAERLQAAGYRNAFEAEFGLGVLQDPRRAVEAFGLGIEAYLQSAELAPFSSRFDDMLRGRAALDAQERRGLALFSDPDRGNCASCHVVSATSTNPARSLFTDFGYDAIGVPRNRRLPSTRDPAWFDLGLCRTAAERRWPDSETWCGYFRTPSLRNVAVRSRFMHNGVFTSLRQAVAFYATRSTRPGDWYAPAAPFDDLPPALQANVNIVATPFNRRVGMAPALSDDDIDAIVAFLRTLTDAPFRPLVDASANAAAAR